MRTTPGSGKPRLVILATGGTIAGGADSSAQAGYASGQFGVQTLLAAVPQLGELAHIATEQLVSMGSQNMTDAIWLCLAARVNELLVQDEVDGVVITHGTDTLEETAYFLNLVVSSDKPVVMTAAMRPATALSADGPLNIYNAVAVAADTDAARRGVLVVINEDIHGARAISKNHTTDVQTFLSNEEGVIGRSRYGMNAFFRYPHRLHTADSAFSVSGVDELPRVDVMYMHAGVTGDLIDAAAAAGARGIVTAGVGNGNMTDAALHAVERALQQGVMVVRSSRVAGGATSRNIEVNDDAIGTVASGDLNPAKARVLLQVALLGPLDNSGLQTLFDSY